jgi:hypothetical protein
MTKTVRFEPDEGWMALLVAELALIWVAAAMHNARCSSVNASKAAFAVVFCFFLSLFPVFAPYT